MGREYWKRVLGYSDYHARDDMTVVVAGLWKKIEYFWLQEKK